MNEWMLLSKNAVVMPFQVQSQMIRPRKGPIAHPTLKGSISGMFPHVSGQFIRTGELPSTVLPGAHVRLLTRMRSQMSL